MLIYAILCAACDRPISFHPVVLCENWQKHLDFLVAGFSGWCRVYPFRLGKRQNSCELSLTV